MWRFRETSELKREARLADGIRIYAIGDIHGRADLLEKLLFQIEVDDSRHPSARSLIVFLGDYVDRGPDSRKVLDVLVECSASREAIFLKGNHESFIPRFLHDPSSLTDWRLIGGLETLSSYGLTPSINPSAHEQDLLAIEFGRSIPTRHLNFLETLDLSFCCGDFYFVHAGIRPGIPIARQREEDLLWIREDFLSWKKPFEKFIVHGHTPVRAPDIRSNRANIDTGAFATGRLTCLAIEGSSMVPLIDVQSWRHDEGTRTLSNFHAAFEPPLQT